MFARIHSTLAAALICIAPVFTPSRAAADHDSETFRVGRVVEPGRPWKSGIPDRPIQSAEAILRRESGTRNTYVNLRFEGQGTFENGKRVQVDSGDNHPVTWDIGGQRPSGKPLVLNVYNGKVFVEEVRLNFADDRREARDRDRHRDDRDERYEDRRGDNRDRDDRHAAVAADPDAERRCRDQRSRRPEIEIERVQRSGQFFSDGVKVAGALGGTCIQEAGYYENGRLKERIEIPLDDRFRRERFEIKARAGARGEIRAYTLDGNEERIPINEELLNQG